MKRIILCTSMLFMVMVFTHAQEKANVLVEKLLQKAVILTVIYEL